MLHGFSWLICILLRWRKKTSILLWWRKHFLTDLHIVMERQRLFVNFQESLKKRFSLSNSFEDIFLWIIEVVSVLISTSYRNNLEVPNTLCKRCRNVVILLRGNTFYLFEHLVYITLVLSKYAILLVSFNCNNNNVLSSIQSIVLICVPLREFTL